MFTTLQYETSQAHTAELRRHAAVARTSASPRFHLLRGLSLLGAFNRAASTVASPAPSARPVVAELSHR